MVSCRPGRTRHARAIDAEPEVLRGLSPALALSGRQHGAWVKSTSGKAQSLLDTGASRTLYAARPARLDRRLAAG